GQPVTGAMFESGSPEIAKVDAVTGAVTGVMRGFATITARRGSDSVSAFVVVTRVEGGKGAKVPGDMTQDSGDHIYISGPSKKVIVRKDGFGAAANLFAGKEGMSGFNAMPQNRTEALFAGPTSIAVDNSSRGGIYVADTLNHSIRKIDFNNQVTTV